MHADDRSDRNTFRRPFREESAGRSSQRKPASMQLATYSQPASSQDQDRRTTNPLLAPAGAEASILGMLILHRCDVFVLLVGQLARMRARRSSSVTRTKAVRSHRFLFQKGRETGRAIVSSRAQVARRTSHATAHATSRPIRSAQACTRSPRRTRSTCLSSCAHARAQASPKRTCNSSRSTSKSARRALAHRSGCSRSS
jgi:hypothetical protein